MKNNNLPINDPALSLAVEAALAAGKAINIIYNKKNFKVNYKKNSEPVCLADLESHRVILKILKKSGYQIISEEGTKKLNKDNNKNFWVVDPLDGTLDFIQRTGEFAVMVGLVENSLPIIGVVYLPVSDSLFIAKKDRGVYRRINSRWKKISVSNKSNIKNITLEMSRNHISREEKDFLAVLGINIYNSKGSCLKVLDIAAGDSELYFTFTNKIKLWDTCASNCIIHEAGGKMTDIYGRELQYNPNKLNHENGILISNSKIHNKLINRIKKYKR